MMIQHTDSWSCVMYVLMFPVSMVPRILNLGRQNLESCGHFDQNILPNARAQSRVWSFCQL